MKTAMHCPRCQGQVFLHVRRVQFPDPRYTHTESFRELTLTGRDSVASVGLEAWVCDGCAYTELYATGMRELRRLAEEGKGGVSVVDRRSASGPHR